MPVPLPWPGGKANFSLNPAFARSIRWFDVLRGDFIIPDKFRAIVFQGQRLAVSRRANDHFAVIIAIVVNIIVIDASDAYRDFAPGEFVAGAAAGAKGFRDFISAGAAGSRRGLSLAKELLHLAFQVFRALVLKEDNLGFQFLLDLGAANQ